MRRPPKRKKTNALPFLVAGGVILLAGIAAAAILLRGGDDDDSAIPATTTTPTSTEFGREPSLDGNVFEIFPEHAATVKQAETLPGNPDHPGAVCLRIRFEETNGTWYRMAVDGIEVTEQTIWIGINPTTNELPEEAQLCYDPPEGLRTGLIDASVVVQEPNGISPVKEIVEWRFRVDP